MNQAAWQLYERLPLPSRREVDWQRFDLHRLKLDNIQARPQALTVQLSPASDRDVIFCDLPTALARHGELVRQYLGKGIPADEPSKFAALHNALWQTGAFLYVPRDVRVTAPLEILYELGGHNSAGYPHTLVVLEPGAEATLIQKFGGPRTGATAAGNGAVSIHASATEVFVKEGGHLHYISYQNFPEHVFDFTLKRAQVGRDAEIDWVIGMFGAAFQRYDIECIMDGEGGMSYLYGVGFLEHQQQFGQFTRQHHRVGNTTSDLLFKNVLRDAATSNYAGLIKVEKNANGTNAYQANRNLVLSDKVKCDTKPILEIESNQLRCTHGATVGRLEDQHLFYLRSRGLTEPQAREVLLEAFLEPVLARIRVPEVYNEFSELIHRKVIR